MKKVLVFLPAAILFAIVGCSASSQRTASNSAPAVVHASATPATTPPVLQPAAALPLPSVRQAGQRAWRAESVKDGLGEAIALKATSLDGKFDLVILERGTHPFLSFVRHARWESVHNQAAKGKLMFLRARFEDGQEKRIEWDELGFATENLYSVLWSYPAKTNGPIGPVPEGGTGDAVGGDHLLLQDMMVHKTMLLEVEPGITTQFDMTGLAHEIEKLRTPKTQQVLEARQTAE
jgi:hypothetical protein